MRGAVLLVAVAACAPGETGLIVEVIPTEGVKTANVLEIFVGYGEADQPRLVMPPIKRHDDDGMSQSNRIQLTEPFDHPVPVEITGREPRPFWVAVRALRDSEGVLGEGGFPLAVSQPTDRLDIIEITVDAGTIEGNRGCPGFWDDRGVAHYIVPADNPGIDCDRDSVTVAENDCDDFDRDVYPGAVDGVCDGHDVSCGVAPAQFEAPCAAIDASDRCLSGTVVCDDFYGTRTECMIDPLNTAVLPRDVCDDCPGATGDDLIDCLRPTTPKVACSVDFVPGQGFCQDTGSQVDPKTWYEEQGTSTPQIGSAAAWTPERVGTLSYGFVGDGVFAVGNTDYWVPNPAVHADDLAFDFGNRRDVLLLSWIDPGGAPGLVIVEMTYEPDDTCDPDGPDCSEPFFP